MELMQVFKVLSHHDFRSVMTSQAIKLFQGSNLGHNFKKKVNLTFDLRVQKVSPLKELISMLKNSNGLDFA